MAANMAQQGVLPMHVQQAATAQQLGPFAKVYKVNLIRLGFGIIVCAVIALVCLGSATQSSDSAGVLLGAGLVCLGLTVLCIYNMVQIAGRQIFLFQQGLIIEHKGQIQLLPWSQIAEVWQDITRHYRNGIYTGTTYRYTLRRGDGYQIKLNNNTAGISELGTAVTQGITRELVPRAMYSIRAGQTLTFGQFNINTQGIGYGRELIPWQQVEDVKVNRGYVSVKKAGKFFNWGSTTVSRIPNFFVFLAISDEMIRQASRRRPQ